MCSLFSISPANGTAVDEENEGIGADHEDSPVSSGSNTSKNEDDQEKAKEGGNHSSNTTPLSNCALH